MVALERAGIQVTEYYAAEIDKAAISVSKHNYPNIIHVGDVTKLKYRDGVLYTNNGNFNVGHFDLIAGGSPCQDLSSLSAIHNGDSGLMGDKSSLFYHFLRLKREVNAPNFLLENVVMKQKFQDEITELMGVPCVLINSEVVSAHTRKRLYWTNMDIPMLEDRGITLQSILNTGYTEKQKSYCLTATYNNACVQNYFIKSERQHKFIHPVKKSGNTFYLHDGVEVTIYPKYGANHNREALNVLKKYTSKLSPEECEKLQTLPVGYTAIATTPQRYQMIGNGWTVDVIVGFLKSIKTASNSLKQTA